MQHEIKCWPQYYCRVIDGAKTFEIRKNDRGYQPGDMVVMREWNPDLHGVDDGKTGVYQEPKGYSGRKCSFMIGYVLPIDADRVAFSILGLKIIQ